jgi:transposase
MKPLYGYSPRGERLVVSKNVKRDRQRVSLLMAITSRGVLSHFVFPGSIDGSRFRTFLQNLPITTYHKYVLMDNVAFHKSKSVVSILHDRRLQALFIPPYTPDFNPIENVFGAVKIVYRRLEFELQMEDRVRRAIDGISKEACSNSFARCWKLLGKLSI